MPKIVFENEYGTYRIIPTSDNNLYKIKKKIGSFLCFTIWENMGDDGEWGKSIYGFPTVEAAKVFIDDDLIKSREKKLFKNNKEVSYP